MATAPSFWAAGGSKIKSADSPNPKIAEAPLETRPDSQQKKGLVLKGMTNGHTINGASNGTYAKPASAKKTNWADEDDDDNTFIAEFMSQDPKVTALETTVAKKDERVKELDALVVIKTLRIAELEGEVQDKDIHISELEAEVQKKDIKIQKLKDENSQQYSYNEGLLREADEKADRIKMLELELQQKTAVVRDLEQKSASLVPVPSDEAESAIENQLKNEVPRSSTDSITATKTKNETEKTESVSSGLDDFEVVDLPTTEEVKVEEVESTNTIEQPKETGSAKSTPGLSLVASEFPTFVTKETLKVVPPAPKPKTLTLGIDMSKYGKKPAVSAAKTVRPSSPMADKNGHTTPWGHSSRQARDKTGTTPEFNPSADIRHMPHGPRVIYGNGPEVTVKLGEAKLATIPKYVLMQCSGKALKYFSANPEATSWALPAGSMDADAAMAHLKWMDEMTYQSRVYSVRLQTDTVHDKRNLHICRAARVLGLNNTYVAQFTKQFCDRIRAQDVSFEFMDLLCQLAYPENDPVFDCLANNLVNQKKIGNAKVAADLEKLVAKHTSLREKMEKIEKRIGGRPRNAWVSPEGSARGGSNDRRGGVGGKGGSRGQLAPSDKPIVAPAPGIKPITPASGEALFTTLH